MKKNISLLPNRKIAVSLFGILLHPVSAQTTFVQKTIYVDSLYGDDNPSTGGVRERSDRPVRSLERALQIANAQDVIEMRPGTYSYTGTVNISLPVTIKATGAKIVTPDPTADQQRISINSPNVSICGLEIDGGRTIQPPGSYGAITVNNVSDAKIEDCFIHDVVARGVFATGASSRLKIANCRFKNFYTGIETYQSPNDCQIIDNQFEESFSNGAQSGAIKISFSGVGGKGFNISGNTIRDSGEMGIELWGGAGSHDSSSVNNNRITGTAFGISLAGMIDTIVSDNIITGTTFCGIELAGGGANNQVVNNLINGYVGTTPTTPDGIVSSGNIPYSPNNFRISNNRVRGCLQGIHILSSLNVTITENDIILDSLAPYGIDIQNSQIIDISNNTLSIHGADHKPIAILTGSAVTLENFRIHGNNFILNDATSNNIISFYFGVPGGRFQNVEITNNSFANSTGIYNAFIPSGSINIYGGGTVGYQRIAHNTPSVPALSYQFGFYNSDDGKIESPITSGGNPVAMAVPVPASNSAPGKVGDIASDANYVYICIAPDTWKRSALASW